MLMVLNVLTWLVFLVALAFCARAVRRAWPAERRSAEPAEERRTERIYAHCEGSLGWSGPEGNTVVPVQVRDVSGGGLQVHSPDPIEPGSLVFTHIPRLGIMRTAVVRHCRSASRRFRIGLEFRNEPMEVEHRTFQLLTRAEKK
jgi:hypothetical protein